MSRITILCKCVFILLQVHFQGMGANQYRFKYLTSEDGLANNVVYGITQDKDGFIWLATRDGINSYDGYSFLSYNPVELFQNQARSNRVREIFCDSRNRIWFSLEKQGVAYYDKVTRKEKCFTYSDTIANCFPAAVASSFYEDKTGVVWIGTSVGLVKYIEDKQQFIVYKPSKYYPKSSDEVNCIAEDEKGNLWLGTSEGVYIKKPDGIFEKNQINGNSVFELASERITSILIYNNQYVVIGTIDGSFLLWDDKLKELKEFHLQPVNETGPISGIVSNNENIWIGFDGGIIIFNPHSKWHSILKYTPEQSFSLNNTGVRDMHRDSEGRIWVATYGGGVNIYDPAEYPFTIIEHTANSSNTIVNNTARAIAEDHEGNLWLGTKGGASILNPKTGKISNLVSEPDNQTTLNWNVVLSICIDKDSLVWLGNYSGGINLYTPYSRKMTRLLLTDGLYPQNEAFHISVIKEDSKGRIWFGTWGDNLIVLDKTKKKYKSYLDKYVNAIYRDSKQRMWVGLNGGFAIFPDSENIDSVILNVIPSGIGNVNDIFTISEGTDEIMWFGTEGGGLIKYDLLTKTYNQFTVKDGLPSNFVYGILKDNKDNLWISTSKGISNFDCKEESFINYTHHDGLSGLEYNYGAYYKTSSGEMVFGGPKGFVMFHPDSLHHNPILPKVYITKIKIDNQNKLDSEELDNIEKGFYVNKEIVLSHDISSFTIEFVALNYTHPEKNQYAFLMEGEIDDWVDWGDKRQVSFTGLKPGTYNFRVKASNNNQLWNNIGDSLKIVVLPPFWLTKWAYSIYLIVTFLLFLLIRKTMLDRIKLRQNIAFEKKEKDRIKELNQAKIRFFTSISHEFRTPLTLISGPLERIKRNKGFDEDLQLINRNTQRLLRLINNLLDFRRVDMGSEVLNIGKVEVPELVRTVVGCFGDLVSQKNISLRYKCKLSQTQIIADYSKLESVLYNIIINSFKYSDDNNMLDINVFDEHEKPKHPYTLEIGKLDCKNYIQIDIRDYGMGIKKEDLSLVFQRFYQSGNTMNSKMVGSGIGLALVKEFVLMHNGAIKVWSRQNEGTLFSVFLPVEDNRNEQAVFSEEHTYVLNQAVRDTPNLISGKNDKNRRPLLMLIEDNIELRNFIQSDLGKEYHVCTAFSGREGLEKIKQYNPEIIVSDIMMPEMNGYQLCQEVKADVTISHIPVILISAKTDDESKIRGIEYGADAYIPKPFSMELLKVSVNKLIEQRHRLHKKIASGEKLKTFEGITTTSQNFLMKNFQLIEQHIDDADLNGDLLAEEMNMSKSSYYRKIKTLTNKVPNELIMHKRMHRSAELLCNTGMNVSEIAMAVGFVNAKHFSTRFKKEFNLSPTQYKHKHKIK